MKSAILVSSVILSSIMAKAAPEDSAPPYRTSSEIEMSCRIKAKEIAAETYRGCVTEQKNTQIEQIKKEYAAKLQALKAHYEKELKKMNGAKASSDEAAEIPAALPSEKASDKVDSASRKSLPKKSKAVALAPKKSKKSAPVPKSEVMEMTVQLKQAPGTPISDESMMDLPEPIPVEDLPSSESSI